MLKFNGEERTQIALRDDPIIEAEREGSATFLISFLCSLEKTTSPRTGEAKCILNEIQGWEK